MKKKAELRELKEIRLEELPLEQHKRALFEFLEKQAMDEDERAKIVGAVALHSMDDALELAQIMTPGDDWWYENMLHSPAILFRHGELLKGVRDREIQARNFVGMKDGSFGRVDVGKELTELRQWHIQEDIPMKREHYEGSALQVPREIRQHIDVYYARILQKRLEGEVKKDEREKRLKLEPREKLPRPEKKLSKGLEMGEWDLRELEKFEGEHIYKESFIAWLTKQPEVADVEFEHRTGHDILSDFVQSIKKPAHPCDRHQVHRFLTFVLQKISPIEDVNEFGKSKVEVIRSGVDRLMVEREIHEYEMTTVFGIVDPLESQKIFEKARVKPDFAHTRIHAIARKDLKAELRELTKELGDGYELRQNPDTQLWEVVNESKGESEGKGSDFEKKESGDTSLGRMRMIFEDELDKLSDDTLLYRLPFAVYIAPERKKDIQPGNFRATYAVFESDIPAEIRGNFVLVDENTQDSKSLQIIGEYARLLSDIRECDPPKKMYLYHSQYLKDNVRRGAVMYPVTGGGPRVGEDLYIYDPDDVYSSDVHWLVFETELRPGAKERGDENGQYDVDNLDDLRQYQDVIRHVIDARYVGKKKESNEASKKQEHEIFIVDFQKKDYDKIPDGTRVLKCYSDRSREWIVKNSTTDWSQVTWVLAIDDGTLSDYSGVDNSFDLGHFEDGYRRDIWKLLNAEIQKRMLEKEKGSKEKKRSNEKLFEREDDIQRRLDLLNTIEFGSQDDRNEYYAKWYYKNGEEVPHEKSVREKQVENFQYRWKHDLSFRQHLRRLALKNPQDYLDIFPAVPDAASDMQVEYFFQTLYPELARREEQKKLEEMDKRGAFAGEGEDWEDADPDFGFNRVLRADGEDWVIGGDPRHGSDREVIESREPITTPIITSVKRIWDDSLGCFKEGFVHERGERGIHFEPEHTSGNMQTRTIDVEGLHLVKLPVSLGAKIIPERIKGIRINKNFEFEEFSLPTGAVEYRGDGRWVVNLRESKDVTQITYSEMVPTLPPVPHEISGSEYEAMKQAFVKRNGHHTIESMPIDFPAHWREFLDGIEKLSPQEKLIAIQSFVKSHMHYDRDNGQVRMKKFQKALQQQFDFMRYRAHGLRARGIAGKGAEIAGVCHEAAHMTTALLREAGFVCGYTTLYNANGKKSVRAREHHACSWVAWPHQQVPGAFKMVLVDGTPASAQDALSYDIPLDIETLLESHKEEIEVAAREARVQLEEQLASLREGGLDSIKALKNGTLEKAVNTLLFTATHQNYQVFERLFAFARYGGVDLSDKQAVMVEAENIIHTIRQEPKEAPSNAGTMMINLFEEYIRRYGKDHSGDTRQAIEILEQVIETTQRELAPDEVLVATAILQSLKATHMTTK